MNIRTLIIDDELLARERLRKLLEDEPEIEVIGECSNGREALTAIQEHGPDLIFLDVQMPVVIFVTAHDKFALKAFEVHAVDYLLKPFDRERFQTALARALSQIKREQTGALTERLSTLLADLKPESTHPERIVIKADGRI